MKLLQWSLGIAVLGLAMVLIGFVYERDAMIIGGSIIFSSVVLAIAIATSSPKD